MKLKVLPSISNSTLTSNSRVNTTSITPETFKPTILASTPTKNTTVAKTVQPPDINVNQNESLFPSSTTAKHIVKTTSKQSIHRLMKKIQNIQRNKKLHVDENPSQNIKSKVVNKKSTSSVSHTPIGNITFSPLHDNDENLFVHNETNLDSYRVASSKGFVNSAKPEFSHSTNVPYSVNNSSQRTYKQIDSKNSTKEIDRQYSNQNYSITDINLTIKPALGKKENHERKSSGGTTLTKNEIDLGKDRVLIWDEMKDCAQSIGTSQDQLPKDDIPSLNPAQRNRFDQWEYKEFNKRVLSSPSFNVGTVTVRAEEIGLVLVILLLWAGAISLFINRWGKLRMLEPYQPQYTAPEPPQQPRPAPPAPPFININIQSTSSMSLNDNYRHSSPVGSLYDWGYHADSSDHLSPRRSIGGMHSVSMGVERSPSMMMMTPLSSQRRVRSAVDLVSLVMQEKMQEKFAATNV